MAVSEREALVEAWRREEQEPFAGWDFSHLEGRMFEEQPPWSYRERAAALMRQSSSVLDVGTGGGERLLALREHWPPRVVVTEGYPPNARLAGERLAPLGVTVEAVEVTERAPMPFEDGEFDLVLNRHSGLNAGEVSRILAPGGTFLTQQIHGLWGQDLLAVFRAEPKWPDATLAKTRPLVEAAGLAVVTAQEWSGTFSFADVAAIVYYLKAIPWLVEGFSVETHQEPLLALQVRQERGEPLAFEAGKYLIEARKLS